MRIWRDVLIEYVSAEWRLRFGHFRVLPSWRVIWHSSDLPTLANSSTTRMRTASVYRRAVSLFRPFTTPTLIGILFTILGIAFNLLKPWPFKIIVDDLLVRQGGTGPVTKLLNGLSPAAAALLLCVSLVLIHLLAGLSSSIANFAFIVLACTFCLSCARAFTPRSRHSHSGSTSCGRVVT